MSGWTGWSLALWLAASLLGVSGVARAQAAETEDDGAPPKAYQALITQALDEYDEHHFSEARALFLKAHTIFPNARTLRGIGVTEYELRNYVDAVARLQEALSSQVKPLTGELRAETERSLARARTFVARVQLQTRPSAVRLTVDGAEVDVAPGASLTLGMGDHVLRFEAPGFRAQHRELSIKGGEQMTVAVELHPSEPRAAPPLATKALSPAPPRDESSTWSSPWLWASVGAVVVGGVVAGVLIANGGSANTSEPIRGDIGGIVQTLGRRRP